MNDKTDIIYSMYTSHGNTVVIEFKIDDTESDDFICARGPYGEYQVSNHASAANCVIEESQYPGRSFTIACNSDSRYEIMEYLKVEGYREHGAGGVG